MLYRTLTQEFFHPSCIFYFFLDSSFVFLLIVRLLSHLTLPVFSRVTPDPHLSNCNAISIDWLDLCTIRACWVRGKTPWTGHQVTLTIPSHGLKPEALYSRSGPPLMCMSLQSGGSRERESTQTPCKWTRNLLAMKACAIIITITTTIITMFKCWRESEKWTQDLLINKSPLIQIEQHVFQNCLLVYFLFLLSINVQLQRN